MPQIINGIPQSDITNNGERKWFSFIKHKAGDLNYGSMELKITVKKGEVVSVKYIKTEENFNICN